MPKDIEELIDNSTSYLRNSYQKSDDYDYSVNKPNYPMLFFFNGIFDDTTIETIKGYLGGIWSFCADKELYYKYDIDYDNECHDTFFTEVGQDKSMTLSDVIAKKKAISSNEEFANGHKEFLRWCIINIIDTKGMSSENFRLHYCFDGLLSDSDFSPDNSDRILVVLLEDERKSGDDDAKEIRGFLSKNIDSRYNTIIVISDRKNDGTTINNDKKYRMLSDVFISINNYDSNFKYRYNKLFHKEFSYNDEFEGLYTVSYVTVEKPAKKIIVQISNELIDKAIDKAGTIDSCLVEKKDLSKLIDKYAVFNNVGNEVLDFLDCIPLIDVFNKKISECLFCEISDHFADRSILEKMADEIVEREISKGIIDDISSLYFNSYSLEYIINHNDIIKTDIQSYTGAASGSLNNLSVGEYFAEIIKRKITEYVKSVLIDKIDNKTIIESSQKTLSALTTIKKELRENIVNSKDNLSHYTKITKDFFDKNKEDVNKLFEIGNDRADILRQLYVCIEKIIKNFDAFKYSFIEEYEDRVTNDPDTYKEIKQEIKDEKIKNYSDGSVVTNVCLVISGSHVVEPDLDIYFLKTINDENEKTKLYKMIEEDYQNNERVQYINTQSEDGIALLSFYNIKPCNLEES